MATLALEALLRRETAIVVAALVVLTLLAWLAVLVGAGTGMDPFAMSGWFFPYATRPRRAAHGPRATD
jgi:predicted metal-binding membrane protein